MWAEEFYSRALNGLVRGDVAATAARLLSWPGLLPLVWLVQLWKVVRGRPQAVLPLLLAAGLADASTTGLKRTVRRVRPCHVGALSAPFGCGGRYGFPSGHAAVGSAVVVAGWAGRRRDRVLAGLAILVGVSRVVLGVHWLGDVLVGFLWGGFVGAVSCRAVSLFVPASSARD